MNTPPHAGSHDILDRVADLYVHAAPNDVPAGLLGYLYMVTKLSRCSSSETIARHRRNDIRNHALKLMASCTAAPDELKSDIQAFLDVFADQED